MSHLDLCCLQKPITIAYGSERVNVWRVLSGFMIIDMRTEMISLYFDVCVTGVLFVIVFALPPGVPGVIDKLPLASLMGSPRRY